MYREKYEYVKIKEKVSEQKGGKIQKGYNNREEK